MSTRWIIGIDEAGRGALAGPVAVGAVLIPRGFDLSYFETVNDSKQLSPSVREHVFAQMKELEQEGAVRFAVSMTGAPVIDRIGINRAVDLGIRRALTRLRVDPEDVHIRLDGLLRAPQRFLHQKTIVRGDQTEPAISLASIAAKVTRDRHMVRLAARYPAYGLGCHKGYGTELHKSMLRTHKPCQIHRRTFIHG